MLHEHSRYSKCKYSNNNVPDIIRLLTNNVRDVLIQDNSLLSSIDGIGGQARLAYIRKSGVRMTMDSHSLLRIIESICQGDVNERLIRNQIVFFNSIMRELKSSSSEVDYLFKELSGKEYVKNATLQKTFLFIESIIEKVSAEQYLLDGNDPVLDEKLTRHTPMMECDGRRLGLTSASQVLLVGSGAIPITGIILCKKFGCRIACLDLDPEAIELSQKVIASMGLESHFTFLCNDIKSVDLRKRDDTAAIIVAFLPNKNDIIENFLHNGHSMDLLIRQPRGPYSFIYDKVDIRIINQLKHIQIDTDIHRGHYYSVIGRIE